MKMQITINQNEIEAAIKSHMGNLIVLQPGTVMDIDLRAGRGDNGYTALINVDFNKVVNTSEPTTAPVTEKVVGPVAGVATGVAPSLVPATTEPTKRVTMDDLRRQQAEEAKREEATQEDDTKSELATTTAVEPEDESPEEAEAEEVISEEQASSTVRPSLFADIGKSKSE
jgi:hypothetical protein